MKRIRNAMLVLLSIFLFSINSNVLEINARENTYEVSYEFIMNDDTQVPEELWNYLPERQSYPKDTLIINENPVDVHLDGYYYHFINWKQNEFILKKDTTCIGVWQKISDDKHLYKFSFVEYSKLNDSFLPKQIMDLLPSNVYLAENEKIQLCNYEDIAGYRFLGWEPGAFYEDGSFLYFGVWQKIEDLTNPQSIDRPDRQADKRVTSDGNPVGISSSKAPHQQLDYEDAFCYEPDVTGYANTSHSYWYIETVTDKSAAIIGMGKINGMPYGAIQAALWNYLKGAIIYTYEDYEVDPDADVYSRKGKYQCSGDIYATYATAQGEIQGLIISAGCELLTTQGSAKIVKKQASSAIDYIKNCPNNYSLADAEYGIYKDSVCKNLIASLVTDKDGNSEIINLENGTYYVKEIKASKGFTLDKNVYTCKVETGKTTIITSHEQPITASFDFTLYKQNERDIDDINGLDQAEFTIKYYDAQVNDVTDLKAKLGWIFKPIINNGKAEVIFDKEHFIRGSQLTGLNETLSLPLGTFILYESKAPDNYVKDPNIYVGNVVEKNGKAQIVFKGGESLNIDGKNIIQNEKLQSIIISINKIDKQTKENTSQGLGTLKGAEFEVYSITDSLNTYVGKIITDENGKGSLIYDENGLALLPGKYLIKEVKASEGYYLNRQEFIVDAQIKENNIASFEYIVEVEEEVSEITIHKKDSNQLYIEGAHLEIIDDKDNVVYRWISDGKPKIIKGLDPLRQYRLHEVETDVIYALADDIEFTVNDKDIEMIDGIISMNTNAFFKESGTHNYVSDGLAHIIDNIEYHYLDTAKQYLLKGKLIDKGTKDDRKNEVVLEIEKTFIPDNKDGNIMMEYEIDLDDYAKHDFVVYEYLYLLDNIEKIVLDEDGNRKKAIEKVEKYICKHEDYDDENQSVHVDELYSAQMVLYKIGNNNQNNKLNGAYYNVKTSRMKKDGTLVNKNLGIYLTGGIYLENDKAFEITLFKDENLSDKLKSYKSSYNLFFKKECISIMDLDEGRYYVTSNYDDEIMVYDIAKGAIIINNQYEDTNITYTEIKAPNSYHIDNNSYTFSVGNDHSKAVLENYRSNSIIYIPKTGVE